MNKFFKGLILSGILVLSTQGFIYASGDEYANYKELSENQVEGIDYQINTVNRPSKIVIIAIHGGGIEKGTSELANLTAVNMMADCYTFEGIKKTGNGILHITSTHFDEPNALKRVGYSRVAVSLHGYAGDSAIKSTIIGGLDNKLCENFKKTMENHHFATETNSQSDINGTSKDNIVNKTLLPKRGGLQLEISRAQRDELLSDNDKMKEYAQAIQEAIELTYPEECLNSNN